MPDRTIEEGTLTGLLELVQHEFPTTWGYIEDANAGRTLILRFDESTDEDVLNSVESFLTDHDARFTRLKTQADHQPFQTDTRITFRVVLDDGNISWDVTRDTRIEYRVDVVSEDSNLADTDMADLSVMNQTVTRVGPGEITLPDTDDADSIQNAHVECVQLLTVETLVPQPENIKHAPTVTIIEHDEAGERGARTSSQRTTKSLRRKTPFTSQWAIGN